MYITVTATTDVGDTSEFSNNSAVLVFENDVDDVPLVPGGSASSMLTISSEMTIISLKVTVNITCSSTSAFDALLISPLGNSVGLFGGVFNDGENFYGTVLDDGADLSIYDGTPPYTGAFQPAQPLSLFKGRGSKGVWTLNVADLDGSTTGVINNWSMEIYGYVRGERECLVFTSEDVPQVCDASTASSVVDVVLPGLVEDLDVIIGSLVSDDLSEVSISLVSPDNAADVYLTDLGSCSGPQMIDTIFDDDAMENINEGNAPYTGYFRPEYDAPWNRLANFKGLPASGQWTLYVADDTLSGEGYETYLNDWSLCITPATEAFEE